MQLNQHELPLPAGEFERLLESARLGHRESQETLFRSYYPLVRRMVHARLQRDLRTSRPWLLSRFSTGDIVQEVFRGLMRSLPEFDCTHQRAFCGFVSTLIHNRLLDAIRHHEAARRDGRRSGCVEALDLERTSAPGPATTLVAHEDLRWFRGWTASLPEREQLLLRLRIEEQRTFEELALQLGYSSESAVRRAYYRIAAHLTVRLQRRSAG